MQGERTNILLLTNFDFVILVLGLNMIGGKIQYFNIPKLIFQDSYNFGIKSSFYQVGFGTPEKVKT